MHCFWFDLVYPFYLIFICEWKWLINVISWIRIVIWKSDSVFRWNARKSILATRMNVRATRKSIWATRMNVWATRMNVWATRINVRATRKSIWAIRMNVRATRMNVRATRMNVRTTRMTFERLWLVLYEKSLLKSLLLDKVVAGQFVL